MLVPVIWVVLQQRDLIILPSVPLNHPVKPFVSGLYGVDVRRFHTTHGQGLLHSNGHKGGPKVTYHLRKRACRKETAEHLLLCVP